LESLENHISARFCSAVTALIVARPGSWRDALLAMLDEIPRIETIHLAKDAVSALRWVATVCPDLVLLDTDLPGGWTSSFLGELKALCPRLRSLVLTNDPLDLDQSDNLQVDAVLVKGCSATVLFEVLESLLPRGDRDSANADSDNRSRR
jgi:DNA-binding NarL/FixJ family response regulator